MQSQKQMQKHWIAGGQGGIAKFRMVRAGGGGLGGRGSKSATRKVQCVLVVVLSVLFYPNIPRPARQRGRACFVMSFEAFPCATVPNTGSYGTLHKARHADFGLNCNFGSGGRRRDKQARYYREFPF